MDDVDVGEVDGDDVFSGGGVSTVSSRAAEFWTYCCFFKNIRGGPTECYCST